MAQGCWKGLIVVIVAGILAFDGGQYLAPFARLLLAVAALGYFVYYVWRSS